MISLVSKVYPLYIFKKMKSDKTIYRMFLLQHEQALLKMRKQTSLSPWGVNSLFFRCQTTLKKKWNLKRVWCFKYSWNTLRRTFTFVALSQRFVFECHMKIDSFCKSWIAIFIFSKNDLNMKLFIGCVEEIIFTAYRYSSRNHIVT